MGTSESIVDCCGVDLCLLKNIVLERNTVKNSKRIMHRRIVLDTSQHGDAEENAWIVTRDENSSTTQTHEAKNEEGEEEESKTRLEQSVPLIQNDPQQRTDYSATSASNYKINSDANIKFAWHADTGLGCEKKKHTNTQTHTHNDICVANTEAHSNDERSDFRAFVIVTHEQYGYLLLKCESKAGKGPHYQLPGGHIDKEEIRKYSLSLAGKYAALRELFEETGLGDHERDITQMNPKADSSANGADENAKQSEEQQIETTADEWKNRLVRLSSIQLKKRIYFTLQITDKDSLFHH
ncbi:hypothetical protein RFI_08394, partial [Reticulomyxa filosa]